MRLGLTHQNQTPSALILMEGHRLLQEDLPHESTVDDSLAVGATASMAKSIRCTVPNYRRSKRR